MLQGPGHGENNRDVRKTEAKYLIALGGNLTSSVGSPTQTLKKALQKIQQKGAVIRAISGFYSTPAFPPGAGPDFVNAAATLSAAWSPEKMLSHLNVIENALGRERKTRWAGRTLDLDIIACEGRVLPDAATFAHWRDLPLEAQMQQTPAELILPHPRLQDRAFVLVPLAEIAPDWRHPVSGLTVKEMRDALPVQDRESVKRLP